MRHNTFRGLDRWLRVGDPNYPQSHFYQHFHETICYTLTPKCDPETEQIVPPCRETCLDFFQASIGHLSSILLQSQMITTNSKLDDLDLQFADCSYLPDASGRLQCFYKPVTCPEPPDLTNGLLVNVTNYTRSYYLDSRLEYNCKDEYDMKGNSTVTCLYSGQWSMIPVCELKGDSHMGPLPIVVLILLLILLFTAIIRFTCSQKSTLQYSRRHKMDDAFVCYDNNDSDYAHETIIDEFEVKRDPPFKLCIHRRDFRPPYTIKYNIWHAIKNSNSAIIVMSESYVDSIWCRDEFEGCYVENLEDPAFGIFVIMMQPVETLKRTNEYMDSFFASRTYLEKNDPNVFEKIAQYLYRVKQPNLLEESMNHESIGNDNTDESVDFVDETVEML